MGVEIDKIEQIWHTWLLNFDMLRWGFQNCERKPKVAMSRTWNCSLPIIYYVYMVVESSKIHGFEMLSGLLPQPQLVQVIEPGILY